MIKSLKRVTKQN